MLQVVTFSDEVVTLNVMICGLLAGKRALVKKSGSGYYDSCNNFIPCLAFLPFLQPSVEKKFGHADHLLNKSLVLALFNILPKPLG
jgi:hypothetical protein